MVGRRLCLKYVERPFRVTHCNTLNPDFSACNEHGFVHSTPALLQSFEVMARMSMMFRSVLLFELEAFGLWAYLVLAIFYFYIPSY
jgi:hypothetical protein